MGHTIARSTSCFTSVCATVSSKSDEQHRLIRHPQHGFPCSRICPPFHPAGPARGRILIVSRMDLWSVHLRLCRAFNAASSLLAQPQLLAFAKDAVAVLSQLARNRSRYQQTPWVYGSNYHSCMSAFATTLYAPSRSGFGSNACAASQRTAHESLHKPVIPSAEAEGLAQTLQHAAAFQLLAYLHCNLCAVFVVTRSILGSGSGKDNSIGLRQAFSIWLYDHHRTKVLTMSNARYTTCAIAIQPASKFPVLSPSATEDQQLLADF